MQVQVPEGVFSRWEKNNVEWEMQTRQSGIKKWRNPSCWLLAAN